VLNIPEACDVVLFDDVQTDITFRGN
jgi:hypothetical protein